MKYTFIVASFFTMLLFLPGLLVSIDAQPIGSEFRANSFTANFQQNSDVAMDANGNFVVVWESWIPYSMGVIDSIQEIHGQRYMADGSAIGNEFRIHEELPVGQTKPAVAMDQHGNFVVTWTGIAYQDDTLVSTTDIYARRFQANGTPLSSTVKVNTYNIEIQQYPRISMDTLGDFVIVWESNTTSANEIYGQRFSASGVKAGSEFKILNSNVFIESQKRPVVSLDFDGDFVVAWQADYIGHPDSIDIYAQRYQANGVAIGSDFIVNTFKPGVQEFASIASDSDGDFVVAWQSTGQDGTGYSIFGQRFQPNGAPVGVEFRINTFVSSSHYSIGPDLVLDKSGNFIATWGEQGIDGDAIGISAQCYLADGTKLGNEFLVNTYSEFLQISPSIAMAANGKYVIVWESSDEDDTNYLDVRGQLYQSKFLESCSPDPLMLGGSESGTVSYHTQQDITSSQMISTGANMSYQAGTFITLGIGFEVANNATFTGAIGSCNVN
ncbi:MAG: hypothetical protein KDC53_20170 [Saprospiraceae bacterium]|nr:hypothetical protein [Saprospiraceae bacterium]